jgi:RNA polymerase sigma factor (sigma-70 family)
MLHRKHLLKHIFIEAYLELSKLREPAAFPGWFRRIVFKQSDRFTRGKHIPTIPLEHAFDISTADFSPATLIEERERDKLVRNAIEELSDNERIVTLLFYSTGYALKDIATFLEVPVTTIKKRLHDARQHLKESLLESLRDYLHEQRQTLLDHFSEKVQLLIAIRMDDIGWVKTLLNQNPLLVNTKVEQNESRTQPYTWIGNGLNPLYEAARNGNSIMVRLLLEYGAVLQTRTYNAMTGAVQFNHRDIVKLLLDHGADPNGRLIQSGSKATEVNMRPSPLRVAAMTGHRDIVKLLLERGAIVDASGQTGRTALHWASLKGHCDIVKLLLDYGADCCVQDELGRTALDWALMRDHQEVANLFQEYFGFEREQVNLEELKGNERYYKHIPGRQANSGTSTAYQR